MKSMSKIEIMRGEMLFKSWFQQMERRNQGLEWRTRQLGAISATSPSSSCQRTFSVLTHKPTKFRIIRACILVHALQKRRGEKSLSRREGFAKRASTWEELNRGSNGIQARTQVLNHWRRQVCLPHLRITEESDSDSTSDNACSDDIKVASVCFRQHLILVGTTTASEAGESSWRGFARKTYNSGVGRLERTLLNSSIVIPRCTTGAVAVNSNQCEGASEW